MQGLELLTMDRETAAIKYAEALEAEKQTQKANFRQLKKVYWHLKSGRKIIDLYETFKKLPLNADGDPSIGIAPLGSKMCFCDKKENGGLVFSGKRIWNYKRQAGEIHIPAGLCKPWKMITLKHRDGSSTYQTIDRPNLQAAAPDLPPKLAHLTNNAGDRFILFDVKKWELAPPDDPLILRQITANLFAVEATFALTKIEKAILRGNL
jgi:hypothetical protein